LEIKGGNFMVQRLEGGLSFNTGAWPLDPQKPTLVFIHGSGGSSILWDNQVKALGDAANVVALDLPGHGKSPGPAYTTVPEYTRAVADFIKGIQAPRPIPVGLSLGGAIVLQLLVDYPEMFQAGVLMCTGAKLKVMPQIFEMIEKNFTAFVEGNAQLAASPKTDPALLRPLLDSNLNGPPSVSSGDFKACDQFDVRGRLQEITAKVLVVSGEDDKLTPPKYAEYLAAHIQGAQRVHIRDAGHLLPVEKPEELNQALRNFLGSL
jgi:pimeloyl-ACP methyl ester carboxylesterase